MGRSAVDGRRDGGGGSARENADQVRQEAPIARYADMFGALAAEARLRIMRLLLSAHPEGLVVGAIQGELGIPHSTLSHHLEKLRQEDLVTVRREGTFLRYAANGGALRALLGFLYAECCTRTRAVDPREIAAAGRRPRQDRPQGRGSS